MNVCCSICSFYNYYGQKEEFNRFDYGLSSKLLNDAIWMRALVPSYHLPGSGKVGDVDDDGFRQRQLRSSVVLRKMIEAVH